jgi:hypothetical protein
MKLNAAILSFLLISLLLGPAQRGSAQAVAVTMRLETNVVQVGDSTVLHISAQVVPNLRSNAERIFSWYVDVLNTNGPVASANYNAMQKSASDNDAQISSTGVSQGANRRGIYDTFMNLPGAGTTNPIELISIPVTGLVAGQTRFRVQAGTGVPGLSDDFLVAPMDGSDPLTGGDYATAFADLLVVDPCSLHLHLTLPADGSPGQLTFTPCPSRTHTVEYRDGLGDIAGWQTLPGAPHNSGSISVTNIGPHRFFRVKATIP